MFDFQKDVLDKSIEKPVVVDFWAPWCGPCLALGPVIEALAAEQADLWELVKVNTEEYPNVAEQYRIRSIPNVKMFYRGEVINEFMGALPQPMVRDWLKKALPHAGLLALDKLLAANDQPTKEEVEKLMEMYPDSVEIRIVLSQLILWDDPEAVSKILEPIKMGSPFYDKSNFIRDIATFLLMNTDDVELKKIQRLLSEAHLEDAIRDIIQLLTSKPGIADGKLAKAAIGIFNILGTKHPFSLTYRKKLDMALWA